MSDPTKAVAIAPQQPQQRASAIALMAQRFSVDPAKLFNTLKATAFKGATDDEMMALIVVSNTYGLNPFVKEIYAFPAKGGGITPIVSVDGWIRLMNDHQQFDGIEYIDVMDEAGKPVSTTAVIYRKDRSRPTKVTEYFSECYRNTEPWNKCPHRMLRHKATIQGSRVAFGFGGIHDEDEAIDIQATVTVEPKSPKFTVPTKAIAEHVATAAPTNGHQAAAAPAAAPADPPPPTPQGNPPADNPPANVVPIKAEESDALKSVKVMMNKNNVTMPQMIAYLKRMKIMRDNQSELGELAETKLLNLSQRFIAVLPEIQKET